MAIRKRAGKIRLIGWLLGIVGIGLFLMAIHTDPDLLQKAHRVKVASPENRFSYRWFTDRRVLTWVPDKGKARETVAQIDTITGLATPFPWLSERFIGEGALSPDRKWVVFARGYSGTADALSLDGKQQITRGRKLLEPGCETGDAQWMPDSRRWVVLGADRTRLYAAVESLDAPGMSAWIPMGVRQEHWSVPLECLRWLGAVDTDHVLAVNPFSMIYKFNTVKFTEIGIRLGVTSMRDYTLSLPQNMTASGVALSPQGDRLAWILVVRPAYSGLLTFLRQRFPWLSNDPAIELRTSRLDGTDMKLIGRLPRYLDQPADLRWLPGGRSVSFVYQKSLWTIAVGK